MYLLKERRTGKVYVGVTHKSMSSLVNPDRSNTVHAAGTGALSMSVGQSPMLASATIRARGVSPGDSA